jgi:photosystem II stability/assembly factor-like uncharacterized protein
LFWGVKIQKGNGRLNSRIWTAGLVWLCLCATAGAQKWQRLGPEGGMVMSLGTGAPGVAYAGTADGHVFASEDAGRHWALRGRAGTRTDAVISRLVSAPGEAGPIFAAVWYQEAGAGGGVFQSEDGGRTWKLAGLQGEAVRALEIAPGDPKELVAGTLSGVFRSNDAGKSWERISPAGDEELRRLDSLAIDPRDGNVIYAGTFHLPWKTIDGGKSWMPALAGLIDDSDIMSLRVDAANPERVYLSACSGIYRSENQGGSWTKLQGIPYAARRTQAIVQDPGQPRTLYAGTTEGLWVTRDAGESWKRTTPKEWDINSVVVLGGVNSQHERVLLGTEGQGILVSDDAGESFTASNAGFTHRVISQLAGDANQPRRLLSLVQMSGTQLLESTDGGGGWAPISLTRGGTKRESAFDAEMVERVYGSPWGWFVQLRSGQKWLWDDQAAVWKEWKMRQGPTPGSISKPGEKRPQVAALIPMTGGPLAFAEGALFENTKEGLVRCRQGGDCIGLPAFRHTAGLRAWWVSANGQVLLVVGDGKLGKSDDAGGTAVWRDLPIADAAVRWIDTVNSTRGTSILLGTAKGLYESKDGGAGWELHEAGLPPGQVEQWLRTERFWITTLREGGMYVSRDSGKTWERVDQDAQRGRFTGLVETMPGRLAVGSQSEGVLGLSMEGTQ